MCNNDDADDDGSQLTRWILGIFLPSVVSGATYICPELNTSEGQICYDYGLR